MIDLAAALRLMVVTDPAVMHSRDWLTACRDAERGGATSIQVRHPDCSARELYDLVKITMSAVSIPVMVNDRLDVALAAGAAGVHLGFSDVPVEMARRLAPHGFILGASVGTPAEVANGQEADYWGVGPLNPSQTKDAGPAIGLRGFEELVRLSRVPCVAIGGVKPADVPGVLAAGGAGVAVVSGILGAEDIATAAGDYVRELAGA